MGLFDFLKRKELARIAELEQRITTLEEEITTSNKKVEYLQEELSSYEQYKELRDLDRLVRGTRDTLESLQAQCAAQMKERDNLREEVAIYSETLEFANYGLYSPHFDFDTSDKFRREIDDVRRGIKDMLRAGSATVGGEGITFNGSVSKGAALVKKQKQLMLRAFNGEADSFIANVDWNNVLKMEERLKRSFDAINATAQTQNIKIRQFYYELKLKELRLTFEYKEKKHQEREEQRAIREQMREEERAIKEAEQARLKAEKEERMYLQALEKARNEMGKAVGEKHAELLAKIAELEAGLLNAETLKQKAILMAQQTKMGYVYVISNIGSFGNDVYKIGMTRRLDPMDRVKELGDASVPFAFDVHALIFSENAPELEATLHRAFDQSRVNLVNTKREFFRAKLEEIRDVAVANGARVDFTMLAEAQEYRESERIRVALNTSNGEVAL